MTAINTVPTELPRLPDPMLADSPYGYARKMKLKHHPRKEAVIYFKDEVSSDKVSSRLLRMRVRHMHAFDEEKQKFCVVIPNVTTAEAKRLLSRKKNGKAKSK